MTPGRWIKLAKDHAKNSAAQCWVDRDIKTLVWTVTYWDPRSTPLKRQCGLGSQDLTATLVFAEVEGVTSG
ncbi:hypothetical protein D3C81_1652800 [compost metagenome]